MNVNGYVRLLIAQAIRWAAPCHSTGSGRWPHGGSVSLRRPKSSRMSINSSCSMRGRSPTPSEKNGVRAINSDKILEDEGTVRAT